MKNRINSLQVIRAFAFLGIFTSHSSIVAFSGGGAWGVSVFLILSGFLMFCSYGDTDRIKGNGIVYSIRFGIGKIKKLYPLHIVSMFLAMPYLFLEYKGYLGIGKIVNPTLKMFFNATLMQSWVPNRGFYFSLNAVSWYLSVSLFLYIMFPFILRLMKKYNGIKTAIVVMICTFALQIVMAYVSYRIQIDFIDNDNFIHWFTYIFPLSRLEDFVIGCNLGYIFMNMKNDVERSCKKYTLLEFGIIVLIILQLATYVLVVSIPSIDDPSISSENWWSLTCFWTITSCALIYVFAMNAGKISKILANKSLVFIGNMSANAFLIHQMVYRYLESVEKRY